MRVGVKGLGVPLISGIAEHDTLISSTEVIHVLRDVDGLGNLGALSLNVDEDGHGLIVETLLVVVVTNLLADVSSNLLIVDGRATNEGLTEKADHLGLGCGLEADLAVLVLSDALVENTVGDLIAELIRVAFTD